MPDETHIPFNRPRHGPRETEYALACLRGPHCSGDGPFTKKCEALLEESMGAARVLLTTSGTAALEICALLADLREGDEVLVPSFTFPSTATAFVLRGVRPIFVDCRADTLNLDPSDAHRKITPRTRAIVAMHYGGVACDLDALEYLCQERDLLMIEDNAHGLFGKYRGRQLGTIGALSAQSFHETKNFSAGEGGAIAINDPKFIARAEILREKGTNRSRFFRGEIDKYSWVDVGSSYVPADILAAVLLGQLESRREIQHHRRAIWEFYHRELTEWADDEGVSLPVVPEGCEPSYHLFRLLMPTPQDQVALLNFLNDANINAVFHYLPLNTSEMGQKCGGRPGDCPRAESAAQRLIRLPFSNSLQLSDCARVVEQIRQFHCAGQPRRISPENYASKQERL